MPKAKTEDSLYIPKAISTAQESNDATPQIYAQLPPLPPSPLNAESSNFPDLLTSMDFSAFDQRTAALQQQEANLAVQRMELTQREAQTKQWDAALTYWANDQEQRINERWHTLGVWAENLRRREMRIINDTEALKKQKTELLLEAQILADKNTGLNKKITLLSNTIKLIQEESAEESKRKRDDESSSVQYTSRARFLSPPAPSAFSMPADNQNPPQGSKIP